MPRDPRVCFCVNNFPKFLVGGAELQCYLIGKELIKHGWEVHFTSDNFGQRATEVIDGMVIHKVDRRGTIWGLRALTHNLFAKLTPLERADADIYHQRCGSAMTGEVGMFCYHRGRKFVYTASHIDQCTLNFLEPHKNSIYERWMYQYGIDHAHQIVTLAEYMKKEMEENLGKESKVIPNGHPIPKKIGDKSDRLEVLWVSRLETWKQPELFLELAKQLPEVNFTMIGGASLSGKDYAQEVKKTALKLPNVDFLGYVPYRLIDGYFERASLFVNTSIGEGFPNTFIQAWLRKTPTITLNADPDCVICNNKLGFHSQKFNQMVEDVRELIDDNRLRRHMGNHARNYAKEKHDIRKTAKEHVKLYDRVLYGDKK